jgi:tRNA(Ile)-lysidine synthase
MSKSKKEKISKPSKESTEIKVEVESHAVTQIIQNENSEPAIINSKKKSNLKKKYPKKKPLKVDGIPSTKEPVNVIEEVAKVIEVVESIAEVKETKAVQETVNESTPETNIPVINEVINKHNSKFKPKQKGQGKNLKEIAKADQDTTQEENQPDLDNQNEIVRGKNYFKNQKRKQNIKRKLEQQKKQNSLKTVEPDIDFPDIEPLSDPGLIIDEPKAEPKVIKTIELKSNKTVNAENVIDEIIETKQVNTASADVQLPDIKPVKSNSKQPVNKKADKPAKKEPKTKPNVEKPVKPESKSLVAKKEDKTKPAKKKSSPRLETLYTHIPEVKKLTKSQSQNEFLTNFLNKVEDYLQQQAYIEPGGKILVAVSGGVDSVVLMDSVALLASKMRFSLYVAHFNHKLRGLSSDADEVLVRSMCKEYNLHFHSGSGNVKQYSSKNSISIEHAARILRYNYFERTARNVGVDIVATAHTEDDLVETFFINLFRGSGLTGLSSMPSKRKFVKNVTLVRPFLQFNKAELYEYAKIRKLAWNEDETNALLNYTRNKIRHDLLPKLINDYNPSIIATINRTAELIQGADEVIKDIVAKNIANVLDESGNERFFIKINMLLTFNRFMQGELLQFAWGKYFRLQPLSLAVIDRILDITDKQTGSICEISSGYFVLRDRNHLIFSKRIKEISTSIIIEKPGSYKIGKYKLDIKEVTRAEMKYTEDKNIEYIDAEFTEPFVEIRNKREGDNFTPLGAPGEMKLSDFLTNEKVSLIDKLNVMVLTNKIDILWVIGYRISDKCKVSKNTKRILQLKFINTDK